MVRLGEFVGILLLVLNATAAVKKCNTTNLINFECGPNGMCVMTLEKEQLGNCECRRGYQMNEENLCVKKKTSKRTDDDSWGFSSSLVDDNSGGKSYVAAAIIVPVLLIALVMAGIYIGYRYRLIAWVRNKMNNRSSNYDEVMIGQDLDDDDDAPLR